MKGRVKQWKVPHSPKVSIGMRIGSQIPSTPIKVVENTQPNQTGFVARIFHRASEDRWFASTIDTKRGLIVYVDKKPLLGQKIQITATHERYATAIVVNPE